MYILKPYAYIVMNTIIIGNCASAQHVCQCHVVCIERYCVSTIDLFQSVDTTFWFVRSAENNYRLQVRAKPMRGDGCYAVFRAMDYTIDKVRG